MRWLLAAAAVVTLGCRPLAAQWTQGAPGRVWAKSALYVQRSDRRFDVQGRRVPWLADGRSDARALFTDVIVGVHRRVDVWLQLPFFDTRFRDLVDTLRTTGFGDIRLWARWRIADLGRGSTPVALRLGAKAPVGSSPLDARIIPVGEGQWDLEGFLEAGHSFWPVPVYAELWVGYRARLENAVKGKNPGGEFTLLAEAGVNPTPRTLLKVTVDGLTGRRWVVERVRTATFRRIVTLQVGGGVRAYGPVWIEGAVRWPLAGRDYPAGRQYVIGASARR